MLTEHDYEQSIDREKGRLAERKAMLRHAIDAMDERIRAMVEERNKVGGELKDVNAQLALIKILESGNNGDSSSGDGAPIVDPRGEGGERPVGEGA